TATAARTGPRGSGSFHRRRRRERARRRGRRRRRPRNAVSRVTLADGSEYVVFAGPSRGGGPRRPTPWSPWLLVGAGLVASLAFAAGLAWYMARPIRLMRSAVRRVANGDLETRIGERLGARRDELADLGRDFD